MSKGNEESASCSKADFANIKYTDNFDYVAEIKEFYDSSEIQQLVDIVSSSTDNSLRSFNEDDEETKISKILGLMNQLEMTNNDLRNRAIFVLLVIANGGLNRDGSIIYENSIENTMLLYKLGIFPLLLQLLAFERESRKCHSEYEHSPGLCMLGCILSLIYLLVENARYAKKSSDLKYVNEIETFIKEDLHIEDEDSLFFVLLEIIYEFAMKKNIKYPIKKIVLLFWKMIVLSLGDLQELDARKREKRRRLKLKNDHLKDVNVKESKFVFPLRCKVSQEDMDNYLLKMQFVHDEIKGTPIEETIAYLQKYLYIPLSDLQVKNKCPTDDKLETLYGNLLPKMSNLVFGLTKIMDACNRHFLVNDLILDKEHIDMFYMLVVNTQETNIFLNTEIINKAITGTLLIILKSLKLNNIYQFEHFCMVLNNHDTLQYFVEYLRGISKAIWKIKKTPTDKTERASLYNYKTTETNLFTCVTVLRIVNKLIKGKKFLKTILTNNGNQKFDFLLILTSSKNEYLSIYATKVMKSIYSIFGKKFIKKNAPFNLVRQRILENQSAVPENDDEIAFNLHKRVELFNRRYQKVDDDYLMDASTDHTSFKLDEFENICERWTDRVLKYPFDWNVFLKQSNSFNV